MANTKRYRVWLKKKDLAKVKTIDTLKVYIDDFTTGKAAKEEAERRNPGYKATGIFVATIDTHHFK